MRALPASPGDAELRLAARHLAVGELEAGVAAVEALLRRDASSAPGRLLLALTAWRMADVADAIEQVKALQEAAPRNGTFAEVLASLYAQVGNLADSLYFGKLATALGEDAGTAPLVPPDFPSFGRAFLNIDERPLALAAERLAQWGDFPKAVDRLEQQVKIDPEDRVRRCRLVELLLARGRAGEAAVHAAPLDDSDRPAELSLAGAAFAAAGALELAREAHARASALADGDMRIEARRVADARWFEADPQVVRGLAREWTIRYCRPREARVAVPRQGKLRIGIVVARLSPLADMAPVADLARAFDRQRASVHGYGAGELRWDSNAVFRGAFDHWRDVAPLDQATLARVFERERLDALIDAGGFHDPVAMAAMARADIPLRLGWLGTVACEGPYDRVLAPASLPMPAVRRAVAKSGGFVFGADLEPCQLSEPMLAHLSRLLDAVPESGLALRDRGLGHPLVVDLLVRGIGERLAARIDVVGAEAAEFYAQVDVAVAPMRDASPRPALEALANGVPVIGVAAGWLAGSAAVAAAALPQCVFATPEALVAFAVALAGDPARLAELRRSAAGAAACGRFDRRPSAAAIEEAVAATRV